jgi:hypothetical protein
MDYSGIIKRFWVVLKGNRTIWKLGLLQAGLTLMIPGILVALFWGLVTQIINLDTEILMYQPEQILPSISFSYILLIFLGLLLIPGLQILWLVTEIVLIKSVDQFDRTGERTGLRKSIRLVWNKKIFTFIGLLVIGLAVLFF